MSRKMKLYGCMLKYGWEARGVEKVRRKLDVKDKISPRSKFGRTGCGRVKTER